MKWNKNVIKVVCFGLIFCMLFWTVQEVFIPKRVFGREKSEPTTNMIGGFYEEPENSFDVLLIGSSSMFCNVNPLVMFRNSGVPSYILGTSSQQLDATYFLLQEGLKTQKPEVVVIDVRSIVYQDNYSEAYNHFVFDYVPFSLNKVQGINNSLEIAEDDSMINYLLPIAKYHTRWKEINVNDFSQLGADRTYALKGYYARYDSKKTDYDDYYKNGNLTEIPERNQYYLDKMIETCAKENIVLIFIKTPMAATWRQQYSDMMTEYLADKNIPFLDYNTMLEEIDLDVTQDFFDDGAHLNDKGATKVSLHLGEYLKQNYNLPDHRGEAAYASWDDDWKVYQQDKAAYFLSHENELAAYLQKLKNPNYTIYVTAKDSLGGDRYPALVEELHRFGLTEKLLGKGRICYQAIIDAENIVYEKLSEEALTHQAEVNGKKIKLVSKSYNVGNAGSIQINHEEYFVNKRGIGFVVYDNLLGEVVDCVTFDIYDGGKAYRN